MTNRNWTFTLNNYTEEDETKLEELGNTNTIRYLVYGREIAPSTNTPHLQGFLIFKNPIRFKGLLKLFDNGAYHLEARYIKSTNAQAADYCKKEGDYTEFGTLSKQGHRSDLDVVAEKIKEGASLKSIFEEHGATYIRNYRGIANAQALITSDYTPAGLRGVWYVGEPGTGKSRAAREENPGAYLKQQNKWWDGYTTQKVVIWDDLDRGAIGLGHHLKTWTDRYPVDAEIKGGTVKLQYDSLIVTSNYTIEELWGDDQEMCKALKRRFTVKRFPEMFIQKYSNGASGGALLDGFIPNI